MSAVQIAVVYCSRFGHTRVLAEAVARGASIPGAEVKLYTTVEAAEHLELLDAADAIIFGTPTYMGNLASEMKALMEKTAGRWAKRTWADKIAGGFTNSSNFSGDKLQTLTGLVLFAMQQGMIWVGLNATVEECETLAGPGPESLNRNSASLGPMASSFSVRAPEAPPPGDVATALAYGQRVAEITARFRRGGN